jgi:hypothetical protein
MAEQLTPIDAAARVSRRHLLGALGLVLLLGLAALLSFGPAAAARAGHALWMLLPVMIAITAVALRGTGKPVDARALDAVRNDELRQASLQRAWRNGFFAVLALQPALALGLVWSGAADGAAHCAALMAAAAVTVGTATVLASLLWYDR